MLTIQQPREEQVNGLFTDVIDLFADTDALHGDVFQTKDKARLAHRIWINHLRQWSRNEAAAARLGLDTTVLQQIADTLVLSSYRLNLPQQLQVIVETDKSSAAQLHAATAYVYDWLVALYTRAIENGDYQHPHDVQHAARQALLGILR